MVKRVAVLGNPDKPEVRKAVPVIVRWLKANRIQSVTSLADPRLAQADFAIALGGDGTILGLARTLAPMNLPILAINLGHLGFLAAANFRNLFPVLKRQLKNQLKVEERALLRVTVYRNLPRRNGKGECPSPEGRKPALTALALNDCYIHAGASRVIEVETYLNDQYVATYNGDGLIVSTPTGSTAYSLAASGPIVAPGLPVLLLTPICPHTLTQRPLLVSDGDRLKLRLGGRKGESAVLSFDGQDNLRLTERDLVCIETGPDRIRLLQPPEKNYYTILRTKLLWGER